MYKRRYKRGSRKSLRRQRRYKRRSYKSRPYTVKNRAYKSGLPDIFKTKLSYSESFTMTGLSTYDALYRGNGPYDPRTATGGTQPTDFDIYASAYESYVCTASSIEVRAIATGPGSNLVTAAMIVVLPVTQTSAATVSASTLWDMPWAKSTIIGPAGGSSHGYIKNYMSVRRFYGIPNKAPLQTADNLISSTSGLPADEFQWHIVGTSLDGNNINQIVVFVKVNYYITFFNRKEPSI